MLSLKLSPIFKSRINYNSKKFRRMSSFYSLWMTPDDDKDTYNKLKNTIKHFSTAYNTPIFDPHVTLLGGITDVSEDQVISKCQNLSNLINKFYINFHDVSNGLSYFQCVYLLCAKNKSLLDVHEKTLQAFELENKEYMPHLSLIYGDLENEEKQKIKNEAIQRLYGENQNYETLLIKNGFNVNEIQLWKTDPNDLQLESWHCISTFKLKDIN